MKQPLIDNLMRRAAALRGRKEQPAPEDLRKMMNEIHGAISDIDDAMAQIRALKLDKIAAFFGPLIEGKNPPLDGNEVASKQYVDDAVARFSRAYRGENDRRFTALERSLIERSASAPATTGAASETLHRDVDTKVKHARLRAGSTLRTPGRLAVLANALGYAITGRVAGVFIVRGAK